MPKESWKQQREFKKNNLISVSPDRMFEITNSIKDRPLQALVALLYITGCRVSELIRYDKLWFEREKYIDDKGKERIRVLWKTRKVIESHSGIKKEQLRYEETEKGLNLVVTVRNLKNRKQHEKTIPFSVIRPINQKFLQIIDDYIDGMTSDTELFPYTRPQIEYMMKKVLPFNIHFIRDIRATHLYVNYDMKEEELKRAMGWTDSRPADRYVSMRWSDYAHKT